MTNLTQIERKFQMFSHARTIAYDVGEHTRAHRRNVQNSQAMTAILRTNRDTILEALRDHFEQRGFDRRIPYGISGDADCCPMACKFDESVDGGEGFPIEIRLFVAGFDRGVFPEYDLTEMDVIGREDLREEVYARESVYPPDEMKQILYPEATF